MDRALLDTDILSEILKDRNEAVSARAAVYLRAQGRLTISAVTVLEVVAGWRRLQREDRVEEFLGRVGLFEILSFDTLAAEQAGRIEGDLLRTGTPIGRADSMIAAIALIHRLPLVTGNTSHYARIQGLGYGLSLQNWRDPASGSGTPL